MEEREHHSLPLLFDIVEIPTLVLTQLNTQRKNCQYCDASIITKDGKVFHAHKAILAACSSYFETTIALIETKNSGKSLQENKVVLQLGMVSSSVFECLLNVIYTSKLNLSCLNVNEIEAAANWLKLPQVASFCHKYQSLKSSTQTYQENHSSLSDTKILDQEALISKESILEGSNASSQRCCAEWIKKYKLSENDNQPCDEDAPFQVTHEKTLTVKPIEKMNKEQNFSKSMIKSKMLGTTSVKHALVQKSFSSQSSAFHSASPFCLFPHSLMIPFASPLFFHETSNTQTASALCFPPGAGNVNNTLYQNSAHTSNGLPLWLQQYHSLKTDKDVKSLSPTVSKQQLQKQCNAVSKQSEPPATLSTSAQTSSSSVAIVSSSDVSSSQKILENNKVATRRSYECKYCKSCFPSRAGLSVHLRSHTGERPYHCSVCGKAFTQLGHVQRHQKVHTGEKPFQCNWCHARVRDKASMHYHILAHKGIKPFQCDQCEAKFTKRSSLVKHKNVHTGDFLYQCSQCQASFREKASLSRHRRCQHSIDQNQTMGDS